MCADMETHHYIFCQERAHCLAGWSVPAGISTLQKCGHLCLAQDSSQRQALFQSSSFTGVPHYLMASLPNHTPVPFSVTDVTLQ